jgi:hypothetical protein
LIGERKIQKHKAKLGLFKGASKNSEFAQIQGAEKISPRRIYMICKQEIFFTTLQLG